MRGGAPGREFKGPHPIFSKDGKTPEQGDQRGFRREVVDRGDYVRGGDYDRSGVSSTDKRYDNSSYQDSYRHY